MFGTVVFQPVVCFSGTGKRRVRKIASAQSFFLALYKRGGYQKAARIIEASRGFGEEIFFSNAKKIARELGIF